MTKQLRLIIILAAAAVVLLIAGILGWWMLSAKPTVTNVNNTNTTVTRQTNTTTTTTNSADANSTNINTDTNPVMVTTNQSERQAIVSVATSFTERYGSYSSDTGKQNVDAITTFMTDNLQKVIEKQLSQQQLPDGFYSVRTQVAHVTIEDYADGSTGATVTVDARRTERQGSVAPLQTRTQTARLQLKKIDKQWKVDTFQWK